jgi:hypothetical protein
MSQEVAGFDDDSGLPPAVVVGIQTLKAGLVSTAVMLFIFLISEAETDFNLGVPAAIAEFVGMAGKPYLGFAIFVFAGVVVWPLLFAAIEGRLAVIPGADDIGVRGILFAFLLWFAFLGLGSTGLHLEGAFFFLYIVFSLLAHLAYGYSLGVFYGRFTR